MRYVVSFMWLITLTAISLPSPAAAQDQEKPPVVVQSKPEALYETYLKQFQDKYNSGDYFGALVYLEKLKTMINAKMQRDPAANASPRSSAVTVSALTTDNPAVLRVGNADIKIHWVKSPIYLRIGERYFYTASLPVEYNGRLAVENRYLKIGEVTKAIYWSSSNIEVATISNDGTLSAKRPGQTIITVSIDESLVQVPITVAEFPVRSSMDKNTIIETLGIPDRQTKKYIRWPDKEFVDGIFYSTTQRAGAKGITVEHWIYTKFPGAILSFEETPVVRMPAWEELAVKKYTLEHPD